MKWKENILSIKAYQPGRTIDEVKKQFGLEKITKLASNENPYGCSTTVKEAIEKFDESFALYPDGAASLLKEALAKHTELPKEQIILGNGSDEIISIISRALLKPGVNTVMAYPTFSQYKHNALVENAQVKEVPLQEGSHDLEAMLAAVDENTAVVWLCTPNNPTGCYIPESDLIRFLDAVPEDVLVVLDEAYREYVTAEEYPDTAAFLQSYPNVIILRTFSKIYGLASFRVGYGLANEEIIARLDPVREPFNVNSVAQRVAAAALHDQTFIEECRRRNREGMAQYEAFCAEENLSYYPSQGNFILIDFQCDADTVFEHLMSRGYIVRSGKALGYPTRIRVTVGSTEENEGVIKEMKAFLKAGFAGIS